MYSQIVPGTKRGTETIGIVRTELARFPVRALVLIIDNLVLIPTLEFHFNQF